MDENVDGAITRELLRRGLDVVRIQDFREVYEQPDETVVAWATAEGRVLVTNDRRTMEPARWSQIAREGWCSPIVYLRQRALIGEVIEGIALLDECSTSEDWSGGVLWLPQ